MGMKDDGYEVKPITREMAKPWIMNIHYAKRMPNVMFSYGLFKDSELVGVVTYGMPANQHLCTGVCGEEWKDNVLELNRLVLYNNSKNEASFLIGNSLKQLPRPRIVVSYSDTEWFHTGYIYQATNWLYTGKTQARTDPDVDGKHQRHIPCDTDKRRPRSVKHRYITFTGTKAQRKSLRNALRYEVAEYPKADEKHYDTEEASDIPRQGALI